MAPLRQAWLELQAAERCLHPDLQGPPWVAEGAWRDALNHLEKVWVKVAVACRPFGPAFRQFSEPYRREREADPLLRYLSQARHSDNHSTQPLAAPSAGLLSRWLPKNVTVYAGRGLKLDPLPVTNRGVTFPVPTHHLGAKIETISALSFGQLGCQYYERRRPPAFE